MIDDWKITNNSTAEATGLSTRDEVLMETTSTSCMLKESNGRISLSHDSIAPAVSVTNSQSTAVTSHVGKGRNDVVEEDLEEGSAPHADNILSNLIPDDGPSYMKHIPASKNSENGATMNVVGGRGDALNITDSLRLIRISENRRSGIEAIREDQEDISNCQIKNPSSSYKSNEKLYHCFNCKCGFNAKNDLIKHMEIHFGDSNLYLNDESSMGKDESLTVPASSKDSNKSCESSTSETLKESKRKRQGPMQKVKTPVLKISGGMKEKETVGRVRSSGGDGKPNTKNKSSKSTSCARNLPNHTLGGTKGGPFNCSLCNKSFAVSSSLSSHMGMHTGRKQYPCTVCSKSFPRSSQLSSHMPTHTKEKPYSCYDCARSFSWKSDLVVHLRTHTGEKPFSCKICLKSFVRTSHLTSHMQMHSGERPHSCNYCSKSFTRRDRLILHLRSHTGEKPFPCDNCSKSFARKDRLILHMNTHTGEKPFSCKMCSKRYADSSNLYAHLRTHVEVKLV
ncbi:gastrula zinc finger protein XlCGF57.1-like [Ischnura elegans]|uniref:gastrula zinc finger protein XlCGF57.1-like n=1 Tax=Ischnura elegans TaxID=197161 RepID=UPI001ED87B33|nr:gastrula zinc finger protein XlCGF57.1-like [Ischnura elegans]